MGITREELFRALHIVEDGPNLDKFIEIAYKKFEQDKLNDRWLTSAFYASNYPGEKGCGRQALYKLMNIPEEEPSINSNGRAIMDAGKGIESSLVEKWQNLGILLNPYPDQLKIEFDGLWLAGYIDAILNLYPDWDAVMPIEVKTKSEKVIEQMKVGAKDYDELHYNQLQAYIFYCINEHDKNGWGELDLKPARGGIILYISRDNPRNMVHFYVEADTELMLSANAKLGLWKQHFLNDDLPLRPKEWKWTQEPCKWCPFKKNICKPDHLEGIVKLSESHGVAFAKNIDPSYNLDNIRERISERWIYKQLELF